MGAVRPTVAVGAIAAPADAGPNAVGRPGVAEGADPAPAGAGPLAWGRPDGAVDAVRRSLGVGRGGSRAGCCNGCNSAPIRCTPGHVASAAGEAMLQWMQFGADSLSGRGRLPTRRCSGCKRGASRCIGCKCPPIGAARERSVFRPVQENDPGRGEVIALLHPMKENCRPDGSWGGDRAHTCIRCNRARAPRASILPRGSGCTRRTAMGASRARVQLQRRGGAASI